ncbi:MAG: hypothetical protein LBI74_03890 [Synergistaceae bacterium]|nr:hypothetical protein [Synergistaceae bacterium]
MAGSATVSIIERHLGESAAMHAELAEFTREMKAATVKERPLGCTGRIRGQ